jgi:hypothetical protein
VPSAKAYAFGFAGHAGRRNRTGGKTPPGGYVACVAERLRTLAAGQPGRTLGTLAAVAVLGGAVAGGWTDRLTMSGPTQPGPALVVMARGSEPARSASYRVAIRTMRSQLSADAAVAAVRVRPVKGHPRRATLEISLAVTGADRDRAVERIQRNLDPGPLQIRFAGETATLEQARDDAFDDLTLLLLAAPVAALLLVGILGLRRGGATALAAAAAAASASLACELIGGVLDVSLLSLVGATAAGILVSLQLFTLAATNERSDVLLVSGLAAAAVFASLGLLGIGYLASIGLGGALGSLLAIPAALLAIGAVADPKPTAESRGSSSPTGAGLWRREAELIGSRRPGAAAVALLSVAILLVPAVSLTRLEPVALASVSVPEIATWQLCAATAFALLATGLCGWAVSRRILLPLTATVAAALPALALAGLLVLTFQDGRFESLLDYRSSAAIHLGSVVAALAVVAALSASQAVCVIARGRDCSGVSATGRWGPAATVCCLIGAAAGAALAVSSHPFIKEFGAALAGGLLLELVLVQALLAPALLGLSAPRSRRE